MNDTSVFCIYTDILPQRLSAYNPEPVPSAKMNIVRPGDIRCSKVFSERAKNVEKRVKRIAGCLVLTVLIILPAGCADLRQQAEGGGDRAFRAYTEELFRESVSSDTISLHYTLKEPENFGITEDGALAAVSRLIRMRSGLRRKI